MGKVFFSGGGHGEVCVDVIKSSGVLEISEVVDLFQEIRFTI